MTCYYCDRLAAVTPTYDRRPATFDLGSEAPRCPWHWRFTCDHCGEPGHYALRFYCPQSDRMLCSRSETVETVYGDFPPSGYWWVLSCPHCAHAHPALDYAAHSGLHPWQRDPLALTAQRWLSPERYLRRYPAPQTLPPPPEQVGDDDAAANWNANADLWEAGYDERGDRNRRYCSDPVLLAALGAVQGRRVLDAGSGAGYLSRLLAQRGATMIAVENAGRFHEIALAHQARQPLDITFHHASLCAMPFLPDASIDAAVANYVLIDVPDYAAAIREIARVLKPGGRFVYTLTHGSSNFRWYSAAADSPRREERTAWQDDWYFVRGPGYAQWGALNPVLGFNRPLRDYIATCREAGLELRDLDEPELSEEGRRVLPPQEVREASRCAFSYVVTCVKR